MTVMACLWSLNGPIEKRLLATHHPDALATTKALVVSTSYLLARRPVDLSLLRNPLAWVLMLVAMLNTPLYARIVRDENPATVIPMLAAFSHVLRLGVAQFVLGQDVMDAPRLCGIVMIIVGGLLLQ
jgi:hypothetical protein